MSSVTRPVPTDLADLSRAIAAACHQARNETDLYQRCRAVLVSSFGSEAIWLTVTTPGGTVRSGPDSLAFGDAVELFRCRSGETELVAHAAGEVSGRMRKALGMVCFGLSVALELRAVLVARQAALDSAAFQLMALRQVVRVLSSAHSAEETEVLVLDFMGEVFAAWWAVLYRRRDRAYQPVRHRALGQAPEFGALDAPSLDHALPTGSVVTPPDDVTLAALVPPTTKLVVPLDAGGERLALLLLGPRFNEEPYGTAERDLMGSLALASAIALKNAELVRQLHSDATTDGLTGLLNRRAIEQRLEAEISRSTRHQVRTTVALIDLDRFKLINDTLGHAAGDRFLVHFAELLRHHVRALDVAGRLGGDEFLVILPMTSVDDAQIFANRFRHGLEEFNENHPEFGLATVSIGLAEAPRDGTTLASLLAAADQALYRAKDAGRNLVEVARTA
jgi:diguanylate cyclase (GGDEF)-like protein